MTQNIELYIKLFTNLLDSLSVAAIPQIACLLMQVINHNSSLGTKFEQTKFLCVTTHTI